MLKLLMRYWDPDSGTISLSNIPLPQVDAGWRRRVQTMMGQETYLFDSTIRENLTIACNSADSAASAKSGDAKSGKATSDAIRRAATLAAILLPVIVGVTFMAIARRNGKAQSDNSGPNND